MHVSLFFPGNASTRLLPLLVLPTAHLNRFLFLLRFRSDFHPQYSCSSFLSLLSSTPPQQQRFNIIFVSVSIQVLMEGTPKYLDFTEVMQTFLQIQGVVRVHNLRIWALSINKIALSAHLAVGEYICMSFTVSTHRPRPRLLVRDCLGSDGGTTGAGFSPHNQFISRCFFFGLKGRFSFIISSSGLVLIFMGGLSGIKLVWQIS